MTGRLPIYLEIEAERARQDEKFGDQSGNSVLEWNAILGEEYGEVAKEACEGHFTHPHGETPNLRTELVQVAAVAVAWLETL